MMGQPDCCYFHLQWRCFRQRPACVEVVKLQASARMMRSFFISVRNEIVLDHLAILHDKPDTLEFGYVGYGVARYRDQISKFSRLDGANLVLPSQHFSGIDGDGTDHVKRRHAG